MPISQNIMYMCNNTKLQLAMHGLNASMLDWDICGIYKCNEGK